MSSPHNNADADADADDEFFRRMNPLHQWSSFFPSAASTLFGFGNCATDTANKNNNNNNNNNNHNESNNENNEMDNKIKNQNNYKSNYKSNYKTNSASQRQPTTTADDHPDMLLFDAVPFNGDTDNRTNSYITQFQNNTTNGNTNNGNNATIPDTDFRNVDITIAIPVKLRHRSSMGSNTSNISPIGNVSSRMLFHTNTNTNYCNNNDCPSDESDDDLDRIMGTQNHPPPPPPPHRNTTIPHNTQPMPMHMRRMRMSGKRMGAAKADNKLPSSSSSSGELNETMPTVYSENSLDDDDDGKGKHLKDRFRARCNWWIVLCVVLVLVGSILIGAMVPFSGGPRQNQAQNSNTSNSTNNTNNTNSGAGNGGSGSSGINSSTSPANTSSLTTSPTKAPLVQPSLRPTLPLEEIVANEIDNEIDNDNDSATQQPQIRLDMGPMVGHTTHDSVTLWAYYVKPAMYLLEENYAIEILLYDSDGRVTTTFVEADPNRQRYNPVFATLTNLEALEVYRYEMRILGQGVGSGSFKTASAPPLETTAARTAAATTTRTEKEGGRKLQTTGTTFEYVLASCMDRSEQPTQKVWDAIPTTNADGTKDYPDFAILAGDTIYLQEGIDIVNFWGVRFDRYWYRNREQRTEPHFAKFVANTPIYAVWNNHDYGAETANMGQAGKEESLRAWKSLWPNPAYPGSSNSNMNNNNSNNNSNSNNGIYYSFYRGDVHYIVTDDHWNRDPFRENRWGAKQTDWITSELLSSRGTFKVIVLGSDILERGWSSDLDTIGAVVTKHSINGVLFNAGDIHRNEYKRKTGHGFPYPVTQITSSGIAKVWRKPFAKIAVDTTLDDPMITVRFFGAANMEADTTWINDSEMVCSAIEGVEDREKEHSCTETIRLSDLSVAS